jgi:hypothetical protein
MAKDKGGIFNPKPLLMNSSVLDRSRMDQSVISKESVSDELYNSTNSFGESDPTRSYIISVNKIS